MPRHEIGEDGLTNVQRLFVAEYLRSGCDTAKAAEAAGISIDHGRQLLSGRRENPRVKEVIEEALLETAQEAKIDAVWVAKEAKELYLKAKVDDDRKNALKALEMVGKCVGAFIDRKQIEANVKTFVGPSYDFSQMTDLEVAQYEALESKATTLPAGSK